MRAKWHMMDGNAPLVVGTNHVVTSDGTMNATDPVRRWEKSCRAFESDAAFAPYAENPTMPKSPIQ